MTEKVQYNSFKEFYPHYLAEHSKANCKLLHFVGLVLAISTLFISIAFRAPALLLLALSFGYGFAWLGHLLFEKNKPTTLQNPVYSFMSDWYMFYEICIGRIKLFQQENT